MSQVLVEKMPMGTKLTTAVNVAAAANGTQLLAANARRISAVFFNLGPNTIYLSTTAQADTTTAFPVPTNTSFLDTETTDAWFAIAATALQASPANTRILEVTNALQAG